MELDATSRQLQVRAQRYRVHFQQEGETLLFRSAPAFQNGVFFETSTQQIGEGMASSAMTLRP